MIKYKCISQKEKEEKKKVVQTTTTSSSAWNTPHWPKTQEYLDQVICAAEANGFVIGADVVRKSVPNLHHKITDIVRDIATVNGYNKAYFLRISDNAMHYHPDELLVIEEDLTLEIGAC